MINSLIKIIEFADPASTWCWGSEPILRKLETYYQEQIRIEFIMGGLVRDIRKFYDAKNNIGRDAVMSNRNMVKHWAEASIKHGMPVRTEGFELFSDDYPSTYPMNMAYKAAQLQDADLAKKFLRRMREAVAVEAVRANRLEKLVVLAEETGLDVGLFIEHMADGLAEKAFKEDLLMTKKYNVRSFPTFLIQSSNGKKEAILRGYQPFASFKKAIDALSNYEVKGTFVKATDKNILDFVKKYELVAKIEIKESFNLEERELHEILQRLEDQGQIVMTKAGNGQFISVKVQSLASELIRGRSITEQG